jgi:hypothetical protein
MRSLTQRPELQEKLRVLFFARSWPCREGQRSGHLALWMLSLLWSVASSGLLACGSEELETTAPLQSSPNIPPAPAVVEEAVPPQSEPAPTSPASTQPTAASTPAVAPPPAAAPAVDPEPAEEPPVMRPAGWQETSHARGTTPDYARLFPHDRLQRIDIQMSAESKQMMEADLEMLLGDRGQQSGFPFPAPGMSGNMPRDPTDLVGGDPIYVPVTVRYDGGVWTQVGMRFKGNSSLASAYRMGAEKFGFRLDFDRYETEFPETLDQRFYGFAKMTFSAGYDDPSLIRDALASEILVSLGLVAARCAFYRIYVDVGAGPVYWGLYTMIEDPSDQMIEAQFEDKSGNLYKPDGPGADWTAFQTEGFEKKSNEDKADYSDVMGALDALHAPRTDAQAWRSGLEAKLNVQSFLDVLAFSRAIGHWDSYGVMTHNYYLYGDPLDMGRLVWISWDHNMSLQRGFFFGGLTVMMDEVTEDWPLIRYLLDDAVYREQYRASLRAALGGLFEKAKFDARAMQLHALVTPAVLGGEGMEGEQAPYTFIMEPDQFRNAVTGADSGLIASADTLRAAVVSALGP